MSDQKFWKTIVKEGSVLNPVDRISEVLFGLIMVLSFTGAISAATVGRQDVGELLWAALGCNLAWGLVDALMYIMNVVIERGHAIAVIRKVKRSDNPVEVNNIITEEIPPLLSALLKGDAINQLSIQIKQLPEPSNKHLIVGSDFLAGIRIFLLVFLCTLPVSLPFLFFEEVGLALRISNGVALVLLFIGGFILAKYAGFRRVLTAVAYTAIGIFLVAITIALGG